MYEKITAELRTDGAIVLTVPEEALIDVESAFADGATCSQIHSENPKVNEEQRDIALEASECLEYLCELLGQLSGRKPPKRAKLHSVD